MLNDMQHQFFISDLEDMKSILESHLIEGDDEEFVNYTMFKLRKIIKEYEFK